MFSPKFGVFPDMNFVWVSEDEGVVGMLYDFAMPLALTYIINYNIGPIGISS
jgi:hypothetical protein